MQHCLQNLEETTIDLKSMPTFRDKPRIKEAQGLLPTEWPIKVAYSTVPFADVTMRENANDTTQEDCFVWPPSSMGDCLSNNDMLVWLSC